VALALLCVVLLAGGTIFIIFSWRRLRESDDAELVGWCVMLGLGLSATAAFVAESVLFPKTRPPAQALRFVVLYHDGIDAPHFDLMLETSSGSALATWRSPAWPITESLALEQLANHRREYLDYEGEISGGRGSVRRIAAGTYRIADHPAGGKLIRWDRTSADMGDQLMAPPLILRKIGENRWSASAS
jgi:hypothetical protein